MIQAVAAPAVKRVPERSEVNPGDTWDLTPLYVQEADWEKGLEELKQQRDKMRHGPAAQVLFEKIGPTGGAHQPGRIRGRP